MIGRKAKYFQKRKNRNKRIISLILILVVLAIGSVFLIQFLNRNENHPNLTEDEKKGIELIPEYSTWMVDWDWNSAFNEGEKLVGNIKSYQLFASYFNDNGELYMQEKFKEMFSKIKESEAFAESNLFLTIVNDRIFVDGTSIQKDPTLISQHVSSKASREKHINDIMNLLEEYQLPGVEIDYEKIDDKDWENTIKFFTELQERLKESGRSLRIVLESNAPIERLEFPDGPEYIMMAYNLYGTHSGPGPKADFELIESVAKKLKNLPGDGIIAIALGGFDWEENGKVISVTEERAEDLLKLSSSGEVRDHESGSLSFQYVDDEGKNHIVWYADAKTLEGWMNTSMESGISKFALWRLGGVTNSTIEFLSQKRD